MDSTYKTTDYDRHISCLMAPASSRPLLIHWLALHSELARIVTLTHEPAVAALRLKWWQESIELAQVGQVRPHPLLEANLSLISQQIDSVNWLVPVMEARLAELEYRKGFANEATFLDYIKGTAGALHYQLALVADSEAAQAFRLAIALDAEAYALVGLLRAIPYDAAEGRIRWPLSWLMKHGLSPAAIEQGTEQEALRRFVEFVVDEAETCLRQSREAAPRYPKSLQHINKLRFVASLYARLLRRHHFDITAIAPRLPNLALRVWLER